MYVLCVHECMYACLYASMDVRQSFLFWREGRRMRGEWRGKFGVQEKKGHHGGKDLRFKI